MPKVSITIPTYNSAGLLSRAIESALAQTYKDIGVLVVDDGSTDATAQVAERYMAADRRVRYIRHEKNLGVSANKNYCLRQARGEYVLILDADDLLLPDSVQNHLEVVEPAGTLWATCDIIRRCDGRDTLQRGWLDPDNPHEDALVRRFPFRAVFYHKKAFELGGYYDETMRSCVDWNMH